jgi:hypothetical protein
MVAITNEAQLQQAIEQIQTLLSRYRELAHGHLAEKSKKLGRFGGKTGR